MSDLAFLETRNGPQLEYCGSLSNVLGVVLPFFAIYPSLEESEVVFPYYPSP